MRADVNRDLLFGLLALQVGLIDSSALISAFQAWTRDKLRPLADHLGDLGHLEPESREAVEGLVALHLKKHDNDPEKSLAAIPTRRSIRDRLAGIGDPQIEATVTYLGSDTVAEEDDSYRTAAYTPDSFGDGATSTAGRRFRVLRPHAKGGLGAVFVALDCELNREVALKQILDRHADDPASRQRFLLEAEITGGLEHPGIVPVYSVGTYEDGRPYYAMRFLRGDTLREAIKRFHAESARSRDPGRRSLELSKLLRRFLDVCNAIEYAHTRGIIHRDIKPSNIIVGRHGETLVLDWGLAKAMGRAGIDTSSDESPLIPTSSDGATETLAGTALGTPSYMSPEQAAGEIDQLGPASDIYSLGATLYHILVDRAPIIDSNIRQALTRTVRGDFPRPHEVNSGVAPELEAICLKAMQLRPEDRYPTAQAMAEEVEAWLADMRYRQEQQKALGEARRQSAHLLLDRGLMTCQQGDILRGLLWFSRGLQVNPADAVELDHALRVNMTAWSRLLHLPSKYLTHQGAVAIVRFSPDGRTLATGSDDKTAQLWDAASARPIGESLSHDGPVWSLAFSPDGGTLATASRDGTARLWDTTSARPIGAPLQHEDWVNALAFNPAGTLLATASGDGTARLWDVATSTACGEPLGHEDMVYAVAFSPDGKIVATGSRDKSARLWNSQSTTILGEPLLHRDDVWAVAFSPDGKTILSGSFDKTLRIWDIAAEVPVCVTLPHRARVFTLAISPDGRIAATATMDNTVWLWDIAARAPIGEPLSHAGQVNALAFSPDGKLLATASADGMARLWNVATAAPLGSPLRHPDWVSSVAFSPDGRILATGCGDSLGRLWNLAEIEDRGSIFAHVHPVNVVGFSPDGRTLATACGALTAPDGHPSGGPGEARLWNLSAPDRSSAPLHHQAAVRALAFSPDGKLLATASGDTTARLWDVATARPVSGPLRHEGRVDQVAFSPDGQLLATACGDGTARLWDVSGANPLSRPLRHRGWVNAVAFSPDGEVIATASDDRSVRLWSTVTAMPIAEMLGHGDEVWRLAFSPGGNLIASGGRDRSVRFWNTRTAMPHGDALWHQGWVRALAFSPDGRTLATGGMDNHVWLWDSHTAAPIGDRLRHGGSIEAIAFSPDGRSLATASEDGSARLWDVATSKPIGAPLQHNDRVNGVAFSPDGRTLATASGDGTARLWNVPDETVGDVSSIAIWTQLNTNLELDAGDVIRGLDANKRAEYRRTLAESGGSHLF